MDENLLGYVLKSLDETEEREVRAFVDANSEAQQRVKLLEEAVAPLALDDEPTVVPARLAERTMQRIRARRERPLPKAPATSGGGGGDRPFWRRVDFLVAACLLISATGLLIPLIARLQSNQTIELCKNNLRRFYDGLETYHDNHQHYPNVTDRDTARPAAGLVIPTLVEAGFLPRDANVHCPAQGQPEETPYELHQLRKMSAEDFEKHADSIMKGYAYSLGFGKGEQYRAAHRKHLDWDAAMPLMADVPPLDHIQYGNSPNHAKRGQNVLYQDGHVTFVSDRSAGRFGDDIYLNDRKEVGSGVDLGDSVLGSSAARPW